MRISVDDVIDIYEGTVCAASSMLLQ
jgi:hypothetical protein